MLFGCSVVLLNFLLARVSSSQNLCISQKNVFTVKVDLFAGELGYFKFEECGDQALPTIGLEIGETYTFNQADTTNYFHPLGFSYFPDGAHDSKDELEPGVTQTEGNSCMENMTCPAPMYFLGDEYLGTYSNIPEVVPVTAGLNDFGLDHYEPLFYHPLLEWYSYGNFSAKLRFTDADYAKDIFYFCHIHQYMSGRIKLLKDGVPVNEDDTPAIEYKYDQPGEFDRTCGTFGLDNYTLPRSFCPSTFVCDSDSVSENMKNFSSCLNAMNCHMFAGMTTNMAAGSAPALFLHQMIPHHQNAVNMAKALLHSGAIPCDDVTSESENCVLFVMMRSIINGQNFQIHVMRNLLKGNPDWTQDGDCDMEVTNVERSAASPPSQRKQRQVQDTICTSDSNVFTVSVNYFEGRLGYFQFEECGDQVNPTIGIEVGETYTFIQSNISNYYHPMGFAYFPDGAHAGKDELEPGVTQKEGNSCVNDLACSAPMYFTAGNYLGIYSNNPDVLSTTTGEGNFGLEEYEPKFFYPLSEWLGLGEFSVKLRFTDTDYNEDLFYFCHIHQFMTGRIKLLQNGVAVNSNDTPEIDYKYDTVGTFDETCGTYDLDPFVLPQDICPHHFVCDTEKLSNESQHVASCFDALNCAMLAGMTTGIKAEKSEKTLFMHQMIPHHENAVNMAKTMLYSGTLVCDDLTNEEDALCILRRMMYEIITEQNHQIQVMHRLLENNGYNATESDDCIVKLTDTDHTTSHATSGAPGSRHLQSLTLFVSGMIAVLALAVWQ